MRAPIRGPRKDPPLPRSHEREVILIRQHLFRGLAIIPPARDVGDRRIESPGEPRGVRRLLFQEHVWGLIILVDESQPLIGIDPFVLRSPEPGTLPPRREQLLLRARKCGLALS